MPVQTASPEQSGVLPVCTPSGGIDLVTTCHDILSALAVVIINVELLATSAGSSEMLAASEDACEGVHRIAKIVRDLQAIAQSGACRTQGDDAAPPARVRDDHRTVQGLLVILAREAAAASEKDAGRARVRLALTALRDALVLHLDYEERELVPLLRMAGASGTAMATRLATEHAAQRASVTALVEDADDGSERNLRDLAEEIAWFARGLERDMEREEVGLLAPDALGQAHAQ